MASPARVLARVLTMAAWLTASIHTGSSHSGWWGTQEALALRRAAKISIGQGNFEEAERVFRHGEQVASRHHDLVAQAWFLDGVGSASLAGFRYRGALDAYLQAKALAQKARDRAALGAIDADLASVYQQVWDFDSALRSAEEAEAITRAFRTSITGRTCYFWWANCVPMRVRSRCFERALRPRMKARLRSRA
jgi:hypothetical protein